MKDINIRTFKTFGFTTELLPIKESVSNNTEGKYLPFQIKRFKLNKQLDVHNKKPYVCTDLSDEITGRSTNRFGHSLALKIPGYARFRCSYYWYIYIPVR
jgi:hypothetical protein